MCDFGVCVIVGGDYGDDNGAGGHVVEMKLRA